MEFGVVRFFFDMLVIDGVFLYALYNQVNQTKTT